MNLKTWALDVAVRAIKTAAQTAVAALGINATGLLNVDWANVGSLAGLAAVVCVLQNLTTLDLTPTAAPVVVAPPVPIEPVVIPAVPVPPAA